MARNDVAVPAQEWPGIRIHMDVITPSDIGIAPIVRRSALPLGVIAPPFGAAHLRSESRGSAVVIAPPCGASHLRSEFRMSSFVPVVMLPPDPRLVAAERGAV